MMDKQCDGVCACHKWFCVIKVCKQWCCCWSYPHQWQLGDNVTGVRQVPEYQHQFNHDELAISMFYQWFWVWIWSLNKHTNQIMSSVVHVAHWHIGHCMQSKSRLAHHGRDRLRFPTIPWQISMVFGRFRFDFMLSGSSSPVQLTCKLRDMTDNDLTDKTAIATTLAAWYSQPCFLWHQSNSHWTWFFASASLRTFQVLPEFLVSRRCRLTGLSTSLQKCWDCMADCTGWIISGGRIKKTSRLTLTNDMMEKQFNWIPMGSIQPPSFAKCHIQSEPAMKRKIQGQISVRVSLTIKEPSDCFWFSRCLRVLNCFFLAVGLIVKFS